MLLSVVAALLVALGATAGCSTSPPCSDVDVSFARGTTEPPGLGVVGEPFVCAVTAALPGRTVSSSAVDYPADYGFATGAAATVLTRHVTSVAEDCPDTTFVLDGWS